MVFPMVIVSPVRAIVLHLPRTGGNAVREALEKVCVVEDLKLSAPHQPDLREAFDTTNPTHPDVQKHSSLAVYQKTLGADFDSYRKVVFRRNVYDRLISLYFSPILTWSRARRGLAPGWHREEFLSLLARPRPLNEFIALPNHESPWSCVDYVGRQETLEKSLREACQLCGLPSPPPLRARNRGEHGPPSDYLDPSLKALVDEKFAVELIRFEDVFT